MKDKDTIIAEQAALIAAQQIQIAELTKTVQSLLRRIEELEDEVARLKMDSNNSSKPPSSDIVKPKTNVRKRTVKKRKRGGQPGHQKHTRKPFAADEIDHILEYEFHGKDLDGLIPLDDWYTVQQVTLPEKLYVVTEHRARKYRDSKTGKIVITSLPNDVQKGGLFGPDVTAMTAFMKAAVTCRLQRFSSFSKKSCIWISRVACLTRRLKKSRLR